MATALATAAYEDPAYLARLRSGEEAAFERMVREHIDKLYAYALRMLGNTSEAADAVQEGLLDARRGLANFRGESRLTTWLHRIVHRRCLGAVARRKPTTEISELSDVLADGRSDIVAPLERETTASILHEALESLPKPQQEALNLCYFSDMSYEEIAVTMSIPIGTVRTHIHRGKAALRHILAKKGIDNNG